MKIKFSTRSYECRLGWGDYGNGNVAIFAKSPEGELIGVLSVNTCEVLDNDHVAIKDWSENEGVLQSLVDNGVVSAPERTIPTGYVEAAVCRILERKTE